ncbi:hypothetical protein ACSLPB_29235, partial [Escherichia coli]
EIRHVNEHGITFQEYRFNEYKNQIEKIAFYLGHETVAKWYGDAKQYQHCRPERWEEYQAERSIL